MARKLRMGEVWTEDVVTAQLTDALGQPTEDTMTGILTLRLRDNSDGTTRRKIELTPSEVAGLVDWWLKLGGVPRGYEGGSQG